MGEYTLNPMYTKLTIENNLIQNKIKIGTNKNKSNPKRTTRLAAEKANIGIRHYFKCLINTVSEMNEPFYLVKSWLLSNSLG